MRARRARRRAVSRWFGHSAARPGPACWFARRASSRRPLRLRGVEREVDPLDELLGLVRGEAKRGARDDAAVAVDRLYVERDRVVMLWMVVRPRRADFPHVDANAVHVLIDPEAAVVAVHLRGCLWSADPGVRLRWLVRHRDECGRALAALLKRPVVPCAQPCLVLVDVDRFDGEQSA